MEELQPKHKFFERNRRISGYLRYICPRECSRLQSFPDTFIMHEKDKIAYKQFGNAVNVDVLHFFIKGTLNVFF